METKKRFRPTKKQYDSALLALGLSDRCADIYKKALVVELENSRYWKRAYWFSTALLVTICICDTINLIWR